jgi:hypothetical protein
MKQDDPNFDWLDQFEVPTPPKTLRSAAIEGGSRALRRSPAPDFWTRILQNRPARLAWGAVTLALVVAHIWISLPSSNDGASPYPSRPYVELAEVTELPEIRLNNLAFVGTPLFIATTINSE